MIPSFKSILLVDDDVNDITLIIASLKESNLGNDIIVAEDGEEAIDFYTDFIKVVRDIGKYWAVINEIRPLT